MTKAEGMRIHAAVRGPFFRARRNIFLNGVGLDLEPFVIPWKRRNLGHIHPWAGVWPAESVQKERRMRIAELTARILLGSIFLTFGFNGFLNFLPSAPIDGLAGQFLQTLSESHYGLVISGFQVVGGSWLIVNRFVGLALAMLAPIIVNILCFHVFMMPSGLALAIPVAGTWGFLAYRYRHCFAALFVCKS